MAVTILGIRHHSPACAHRVRHHIRTHQPQAVLIEGPADFNPRIQELLLQHELPIALYSYANEAEHSAQQCWYPLLDYSPEWVALQEGAAAKAELRFIDLPHWRYRTRKPERRPQRDRYAEVVQALCRRTGCDGDDALWDHLFEALPPDDPALAQRLDTYFQELRDDEEAGDEDEQREACMARWIAWAAARFERVLVVCGGWHLPALQRAWPQIQQTEEPISPQPANEREAGCYLVPYEFRQVDALGGYAAGMPSPFFYQQQWRQGGAATARWALRRLVDRLRARQQIVSTADLIAFEQQALGLARLRGHAWPLRVDLLDALQSTLLKEALDEPAPWSGRGRLSPRHHPLLREALLALTGEGGGRLHASTPLPPLVHDARERLQACALEPRREAQHLVLDRRRPEDLPRARLLWQLRLLGVGGARLKEMKAPRAARALAPALAFEEHWLLQQDERWFPDLIEAAVHGATLQAAAQQALLLRAADGNPAALAEALRQALRAGLHGLGQEFAQRLQASLAQAQDHGELAQACIALAELVQAGFWGEDPRPLLEATLVALAERLLWRLEGRDGAGSAALIEADVRSLRALQALLRLDLPGLDAGFLTHTAERLARSASKPPALRGAALGLCVSQAEQPTPPALRAEVLALTRAMPPREALGDFLYGLFACARALATEDEAIVRAVHAALEGLGHEDFLVALPALRAAFAGFPPRERGAIADLVAPLLGLPPAQRQQLLKLRQGTQALLDAKRIEAQALAWAREHGVLP
ncbi:DUF5682 family protein [Inhella sp.]|uniref:DUF5682 family protein n=1 Tax=Inhella sp. TaxID=1921806 RepID=UPI0035AFC2AE